MQLGERIKYLLNERQMTRKEFSCLTGITEAALSRYITGQREPKALTLSVIAHALNVSVDELLGTPCSDPSVVEDAVDLVARSATQITAEQKRKLLDALINY
jgi:transcriptional regulator with XRE-family HTH domain